MIAITKEMLIVSVFVAFMAEMLMIAMVFRWTGSRLDDGEFKLLVGMVFGAICLALTFYGISTLIK